MGISTTVSDEGREFLAAIHGRLDGDTSTQVSMYEVGQSIGWETDAIERVAQDLMGDGLLEFRTLSGGVAMTAEGVDVVAPGKTGASGWRLGNDPVLDETKRSGMESLLDAVKSALRASADEFERLAERVADIRTVDAQMASPRPKTAILRACLEAIRSDLPAGETRDRVRSVLE